MSTTRQSVIGQSTIDQIIEQYDFPPNQAGVYISTALHVVRTNGFKAEHNPYWSRMLYRGHHLFDTEGEFLVEATGGYRREVVTEPLVYKVYKVTEKGQDTLLSEQTDFYTVNLKDGSCNCRARSGRPWELYRLGAFTSSGQDLMVCQAEQPPSDLIPNLTAAWKEVYAAYPAIKRHREKYRLDCGSSPALDCKHLVGTFLALLRTGK